MGTDNNTRPVDTRNRPVGGVAGAGAEAAGPRRADEARADGANTGPDREGRADALPLSAPRQFPDCWGRLLGTDCRPTGLPAVPLPKVQFLQHA
jgi:hypothetical protein